MATAHDWPDRRVLDLLGIELPILQAPMAGANGSAMAAAVSEAGGLGGLPCAMLSPDRMREEIAAVRAVTARPFQANFFCHTPPSDDSERETAWRARLATYYGELGLDPDAAPTGAARRPFDEAAYDLVEELKPPVVSFHFGLPEERLLARVRVSGAKVLSSATTVAEARWLEDRGCDAILAQGAEAGGHRGMFLATEAEAQVGTFALVPQVVDAVRVPVIATGGIADARGIVAAFVLGASAVQLGTAYLFCPEATLSDVHRRALHEVADDGTALTNVFSGRPARGILNRLMREVGPMSDLAPAFPNAASGIGTLRSASEKAGKCDFAQMWSGQAAPLSRGRLRGGETSAGELTRQLAAETLAQLGL